MSTQTTQAVPANTKAEKSKKERKSFNVRLAGADGASLRITAARKRDGAVTFATHTTKDSKGKKVNQRGATEQHANIEAAKAVQAKLVAQAAKMGWKVRESRRGGFVAKPDAFDMAHLPTPGKTSSKK